MSFTDFIWPRVGKVVLDETLEADLEQIDSASWGGDIAAFLEEARRLRDVENNRKSIAEMKSQIYLAGLLALIPILVTLTGHDALKDIMGFSVWYQIVVFILFALGITYGVGAFFSSFRVLMVQAYHRVDVEEIVSSRVTEATPMEQLTKEILKSVRRDRSNINQKVSHVIVTHQLIFRMAVFLLLALLLVTFVPKLDGLFSSLKGIIC
ncbi:MAG: hypothetical protein JAZ11_02855 [Candidatus Thiodiazotropha lotti]|nr:hypothetical protein [Candidatus Thiodiazotropha lotti]